MTPVIPNTLLRSVALLLQGTGLYHCQKGPELRALFLSALAQAQDTQHPLAANPRLVDGLEFGKPSYIHLTPGWIPQEEAVAVGETRLFAAHFAPHHAVQVGSRLKSLYELWCIAHEQGIYTFFFDLVLNPTLLDDHCYRALAQITERGFAANTETRPLKMTPGIRAYAASTSIAPLDQNYDFLFPPVPIGETSSPIGVLPPIDGGFIRFALRQSHQTIPYRALTQDGKIVGGAAFVLFAPGGDIAATVEHVPSPVSV